MTTLRVAAGALPPVDTGVLGAALVCVAPVEVSGELGAGLVVVTLDRAGRLPPLPAPDVVDVQAVSAAVAAVARARAI